MIRFKKLRAFTSLRPDERLMVLQALALLPVVAGSLKVIGFRATRRLLGVFRRLVPLDQSHQSPSREALAAAKSVEIAARHAAFFKRNCLHESLTVWWMLRRKGKAPEIRIGVRKDGGGIEAHAWVVCDGLVLTDGRNVEELFSPFARGEGIALSRDATRRAFRERP